MKTKYCSKSCQAFDRKSHKTLCHGICRLIKKKPFHDSDLKRTKRRCTNKDTDYCEGNHLRALCRDGYWIVKECDLGMKCKKWNEITGCTGMVNSIQSDPTTNSFKDSDRMSKEPSSEEMIAE